jgi:ABC-type bacteriocin/lantibiotic exporter with double-glycine peptidase domain
LKRIVKNISIILDAREKRRMVQLILLDILVSILDIAFLAMLLWIIQFYTHPAPTMHLPNAFLHQYPLLPIIVFFILFSVKNFLGFRVFRLQLKFVYGVASRLSQKNVMNYLNGSYNDYVNIDSSVHIRKISQQPIEFCHYVLAGFQQVVSQSVLILITVVAILAYNPVLFPLLLLILAPPIVFIAFLMKKKLNTIRKTVKPVSEKTIQYLKEALSGFIESNIYNNKNFFANRYHSLQSGFNDFLSEQLIVQNMPSRLIEVFAILGLLILIIIHSFTANVSSISIVTIGAFMAAAYKIIPGIIKILSCTGQIKTYQFTITDLMQANSAGSDKNSQDGFILQSVSFKNVSFSFQDKTVLNDFSFTISKGDFMGLSGISGKGKTTLINVLLDFLEPSYGSVLLNNICMKFENRRHFRKRISYVKQQPLLIYDSILKNITLSEKPVDFQKIEEVIRVTGLSEVIASYPEGFNKIITENGKNLSGGQRQRLMLARALYKPSDLLILDEPFSELDRDSENCLLTYLNELALAGKMILLITHHKESLSFCNKIISLDEKQSPCFGDIDTRLS